MIICLNKQRLVDPAYETIADSLKCCIQSDCLKENYSNRRFYRLKIDKFPDKPSWSYAPRQGTTLKPEVALPMHLKQYGAHRKNKRP